MSTFLQLTFAGLNVGTLYMLIALGMVVTYQVARVESLAQGVFVVYSALTFMSLHDGMGLPLPVAMLGSILVCAVIGVALNILAMNRFAARGSTGPVLMLLGAALVFAEVAKSIWGLNDAGAKPWLSNEPIFIGGATVLPQSLLVWIGTAALVGIGYVLFERTIIGKALRASADDLDGAQLVGIRVNWMRFLSFQIAAFFGAVAGILLAPLLPFGWSGIFPLVVLGSIGAIAGRWEYIPAAVASIVLGLFSSYTGGYISTQWQSVFLYGAFIVILLILREDKRPGARRRSRFRAGSEPVAPHESEAPSVSSASSPRP